MGAGIDIIKTALGLPVEKAARDPSRQEWVNLANFLGIDPDTDPDARSEATYFACLKIRRETLGKLPFRLMRTAPSGGIEIARAHPLYATLSMRPNPYTGAALFWASIENDRLHEGNGYAWIQWMSDGGCRLWQMPACEVEVWWDATCALCDVPDVYYLWSRGGRVHVLKSYEVLHFRESDSPDGVVGVPTIARLRELVSGSVRAQGFQNELISSGLTAKAVLQYTANLDEGNVTSFTANLERYAKGDFAKAGVKNIIPIPVGTTLQPLNTKLTDAQFAELKRYSAAQIAAAFGIKPQQVNDMTKQSYASSQAQQETFYQDTMLFTLTAYENEIAYKLIGADGLSDGYFVEADTEVMLRSDYETTVKANKMAIESLQMKPNEARAKLRLPSDPDGDTLVGNGNLIPASMIGTQYARGAAPNDEAGDAGDKDSENEEGGDK